uniref:Uncharacterized protein n=1 Tax=Solanum lycopersicum TaxID=4081 RepID=A0A3Q7HHY5_SOLLC
MPNFFVDVHQDLVYAYGWPSRLFRPILKDSDDKNAKFFPGRLSRPFLCIWLAIKACTTHLKGQTNPEASIPFTHHFLGDLDSDMKNAKFFHGRPSRPCICIRLATTACPTHLKGQTSPEASIPLISTIFVCYSTPFLGDLDSDVKNSNFFCERPSRPCLCIRLAITACTTNLEGQRAPKRPYLSFRRFSCAIAHHFLGDPGFRRQKCQIFSWTSVKTLSMHTIGHHGLSDPFGRSNEPRSEHIPHFDDFHSDIKNAKFFSGHPSRPCLCIQLAITAFPTHLEAHHFLGDPDSDVKNAKYFHGRPSRHCLCMRLAITACPTHLEALHFFGDLDFDVKNVKLFRGRLSRPFLCIRLAITACTNHLEGQTTPEASIPLISTIFVCYSTPFFG